MSRTMPDPVAGLPHLRIRLLGGFGVTVGVQPVPPRVWRQRRTAAMVKLLALEPTHRLHREQLMDQLWPELSIEGQGNNLRQILHHARKHLSAAGMPPGLALTRDGDMIVLAPRELVWVDVHVMERSIAAAWREPLPDAARDALALYTGDLLPEDRYEVWAEDRRTTLRASYLALLEHLSRFYAERGESGAAIATLRQFLTTEPARERVHQALMHLYAQSGHPELALAQYDRLLSELEREAGEEPEAQTRELAAAIIAGRYPCQRSDHPLSAAIGKPATSPGVGDASTGLGRLFAREREIAETSQLLESQRLVTLTGPGGIGKTRLALAVAAAMEPGFPDGVFFVDLAPIRDPALVAAAIAQAIDLRTTDTEPMLSQLELSLQRKRSLLILDNFEQIVEAAPVVSRLLQRATQLRVLVTSRMRLGLQGERQVAVPALATPSEAALVSDDVLTEYPATALFLERARGIVEDFDPTGEDAIAVARICERLSGLPLAIELAAARTAFLSPREMLVRFHQCLQLLTGGPRDLPARQQTLRATIQWSYDLLDPHEQQVFRQLAVFRSSWTLEAAEAVIRCDEDQGPGLLECLASLVDKSLVVRSEQRAARTRFDMLETVREFGREQLAASADEDATRERHADYFRDVAEEAAPHLEGIDQAVWLRRLDAEDADIRAAVEWLKTRGAAALGLRLVTALVLYWYARGRLLEGCARIVEMTELPTSGCYPELTIDALNRASFLARETGDSDRAYLLSRRSLAFSRRLRDRKRAADALANLGYVSLQQGKAHQARHMLQQSFSMSQAVGNQQGIADAMSLLAVTAASLGELETALQLNEQSLSIWIELDDRQATVCARARLGAVLTQLGEHQRAYDEFLTSLDTCRELEIGWGFAWTFDGLAQLVIKDHATELAARLAAAAASIRERTGIRRSAAEQAAQDRLLDQLRVALGDARLAAVWDARHEWELDELVHATRRLIGLSSSASVSGRPG